MDIMTWSFIGVIVLGMAGKIIFEWRMYRKSIYHVLYSNFTEYRMRKKSVERMSESEVLESRFGAHKMVYHVLDEKQYTPASYVTIFLTSGIYLVGIQTNSKVTKSSFSIMERFYKENISQKIKNSAWQTRNVPVHSFIVISDSEMQQRITTGMVNNHIITSNELLDKISMFHFESDQVETKEDISGIFQLVAKEEIEAQNVSMMG